MFMIVGVKQLECNCDGWWYLHDSFGPEGLLQGEGICQLSQLPPVLEEARVRQVSKVSNSLRNSL